MSILAAEADVYLLIDKYPPLRPVFVPAGINEHIFSKRGNENEKAKTVSGGMR